MALQKLSSAENLDPTYWETYRTLAYIYTVTKKAREAVEAGQTALKLNDLDANTYNNLAWVYATSDDKSVRNLELALKYANEAVNLTHAQTPEFLDTLAEVHLQRGGEGERDIAMAYLKSAIEIAPSKDKSVFLKRLNTLFPGEK